MSAADDLRALTAAATPGPWHPDEDYIRGPGGEYVANVNRATNTELVVWLRNHADALADLIAAVGEMPIHGSDPAVSYCFICKNDAPCPTERAQLALAALEADRG